MTGSTDAGREQGTPRPLEDQLGFRLGRTHRMVRDAWEDRIADVGLSGPQAAALRAIGEGRPAGLRELARHLCTDPMNARRLVDHLERRGLVASAPDPDHRQRRAPRLTEAGGRACAALASRGAAWEQELETLLGASELATLRSLLSCLDDALGSQADATPRRAAESRP